MGLVLIGNTAIDAEPEQNGVHGCWVYKTAASSDGETDSQLCFKPDGNYALSWKTCSAWQVKEHAPCEGWGLELSYRRKGNSIELQRPDSYGADSKSYCTQDLNDFDQTQFVACFMPGVKWTKQSDSVKGK